MMNQPEKTDEQIQAMREGGKILADILARLKKYVEPGMTGIDINQWVSKEILRLGATATYREPHPNFPGVICISTNEAIVHGVPSEAILETGDVVGFDLVITYKGMKTDSAFTMVVGKEPEGAVRHLIQTTEKSLYAGIAAIKGAGSHVGDVGFAVEQVLSQGKLGVIRDLVGHGVGLEMHMPPDVPNYGQKGTGYTFKKGDTIAIEPMATLGGENVVTDPEDRWTILTRDGGLAAHFEHTVLITDDGAEILTKI